MSPGTVTQTQRRVAHLLDLYKKGQKVSATFHETGSGTFRVLINGQVHPLWVGFLTKEAAEAEIKQVTELLYANN
jgi:hypothetical protein